MPPAFSSPRQLGAFVLLLFLLLLSPVLVGKSFLPSREQMYAAAGSQSVDFPHLHRVIYVEKGDIDIAIMGSSRMGCALDPVVVQEKLSQQLGRPAVVRSLTWAWNGYDALYFVMQDLLEHRRVHMIVMCDVSTGEGAENLAHCQTSYWFRMADNAAALTGLPIKSKASFYAGAILGMPRNLVGLLRSNLAPIPSNGPAWNRALRPFTPDTTTGPSDVLIYSEATKDHFYFSTNVIGSMQLTFMRRIGAMAQQNGTKLVCMQVPELADKDETYIAERMYWPDAFGTNATMVGIPPATMFAGLTEDEVGLFFYNYNHLNQNGTKYETRLLAPSLVQIYEDQIKP